MSEEIKFEFIDEINKEFVQAVHDWKILLKEKDKEIERLTRRVDRYENMFRSRTMKRTRDIQKDIKLYMNQLAIQELEKVKKYNDLVDKFIDQKNQKVKRGGR